MFIGSFDAQKYELISILATVWRHFFVLPPLPDVWSSQIGERYKLVERELLWTLRHQGMVEEVMWQRGCIDNLSEADTQHLTALVEDDSVPWRIKCGLLLQWYLDQIPDDIEAAIYALGDFLMCKRMYQDDLEDKEEEQQRSGKPVFSFSEDAGCIYAAFREAYGIDLQQIDYMHWWEFRSLFDWLPDGTEIKQRIMYRSIDPGTIRDKDERKRIKKIQRAVALKKKQRKLDDYEIGDMFS